MKTQFRLASATIALLCIVATARSPVVKASGGTVSMLCNGATDNDPKTVSITLVVNSMKWNAVEDQPHYFPKTHNGVYRVTSPNDVFLFNSAGFTGPRIGELRPIVPGQAKKGDIVNGTIDDSGSTLSCKVN